jgi:HAD superfamily hydrolase (TIGR01509 family)
VLRAAGIDDAFDAVVDGGEVARLGLRGKPAPDGFVEAARRVGVPPRRAAVVEDALAGVEAGRAGKFGLVIGVSRHVDQDELRDAGAHVVVTDLEELAA